MRQIFLRCHYDNVLKYPMTDHPGLRTSLTLGIGIRFFWLLCMGGFTVLNNYAQSEALLAGVDLLVRFRADVNQPDEDGDTALYYAFDSANIKAWVLHTQWNRVHDSSHLWPARPCFSRTVSECSMFMFTMCWKFRRGLLWAISSLAVYSVLMGCRSTLDSISVRHSCQQN